jgi:Mg-chelatase subunit ChlD
MLVDSMASIRSGVMPNRAYERPTDAIDTTVSVVIVVDESGSMSYEKRMNAMKGALLIADALEAVKCPVAVIGFRNGARISATMPAGMKFHRKDGVHIDVFKDFAEPFTIAKERFGAFRGVGGTPMADGVQHALDMIQKRDDAHRIVFVLTDGVPDHGHLPVIRHQVRVASKAEIHVIGVGIGAESSYVQTSFPEHIYVPKVADLSRSLIDKLNQIVDTKRLKVTPGRRMSKE